jgi:tRNA(Ile2) C34 agmatinyltransferase TiaS
MKENTERPNCPKCKKPMRLISTGTTLKTFYCSECKKTEAKEIKETINGE